MTWKSSLVFEKSSEFEQNRVEYEKLKSDVRKDLDINLHENTGTVFDLTCMNKVASTYAGQVCLPRPSH